MVRLWTKEKFIEKAIEKYGSRYNYDLFEFKGMGEKSWIKCNIHGLFLQKPRMHLESKVGCQQCVNKYISQKISHPHKPMNFENFVKKYKKNNTKELAPNKWDSSFAKNTMNVICEKDHSYVTTVTNYVKNTWNGCKKCYLENARVKSSLPYKKVIEKCKVFYNSAYEYGENLNYKKINDYIDIFCKKHSCWFKQTMGGHSRGFLGCKKCSKEHAKPRPTYTGVRPTYTNKTLKGFLYFIKIGKKYKIGITANYKRRMQDLKVLFKQDIEVIEIIECHLFVAYEIEQMILKEFVKFRIKRKESTELFSTNILGSKTLYSYFKQIGQEQEHKIIKKGEINNMLQIWKTDSYKLNHWKMYPKSTQYVYSNLTPRDFSFFAPFNDGQIPNEILNSKILLQYLVAKLEQEWIDNFFEWEWAEIQKDICRMENNTQLDLKNLKTLYHQLWNYGQKNSSKLPLKIEILEADKIKKNTPIMTIINTDSRFYWLTNYIESWILNEVWSMFVSYNLTSKLYAKVSKFAIETCDKETINNFLPFQCHDFSFRGISSIESAINTGLGFLQWFNGTDNIPSAIEWGKYNNVFGECKARSVIATEHSIMSAGGKENEINTYRRLCDLYPNGILSVVSDTWDYWNVLTNILPKIKKIIMRRNGKFVVRPDSGSPLEILCGANPDNPNPITPEEKGTIRLLDEIFGSVTNEKGYKILDSHIGIIYGDGMSLEIVEQILTTMKKLGYASSNIVFGIGSSFFVGGKYGITRDTFGFAVKACMICVRNKWRPIFKDPITDNGIKKSLKGFINVYKKNEEIIVEDNILTLEALERNKEENGTLWFTLME